ncbi:phosphoribosyltransferase [Nitrosopumilus zosterae]|uniref:Phosphoribosyltransferase n=1 Tax=Nitrosopumilus zosterae TaxID=718286 RepID=A0A2S2KSS9_9ARCH|nr:phosphoribosyltransferase [Nitrosopumilus zosterae]BDQ30778.1 phosphoribosyltransferase [Nitrosopumilus zosterae]GBH34607.1 phosphoribosyltransferase [Nitrosopumilus zosterae]
MTLKQNVDWNEIESLVNILSKKITKLSRTFSTITTIGRGGLVPSRLLADRLGIEKILVDKNKISSDSLFVDDIFDTGDTFTNIIPKVDNPSKLVFATLFARRGKKYPSQLIYAKKTDNSAYVVFPWDRFEFKRSQN